MSTKIEWCDEVINPIQDKTKGKSGRGYHCTKVSEGCQRCYAENINQRFGNGLPFDGRTTEFELIRSQLEKPLKWKKPRRIFVQSMSDIFHESMRKTDYGTIWENPYVIYDAMINSPQHTFLVLTKRPYNMLEFYGEWIKPTDNTDHIIPGISAENQQTADERIPILLQIPAAKRFVSLEPMLAPVDISYWLNGAPEQDNYGEWIQTYPPLDWVILGGLSLPGGKVKPPALLWISAIERQCNDAGVPLFIKDNAFYDRVRQEFPV